MGCCYEEEVFLKSQSSLQRKIVAGGLSAVFGAGMYGSYAGAMNLDLAPGLNSNVAENKLPKVEGEIGKITYKNPNGQQGEVECRLKNDKIEFKMYGKEKFGNQDSDYKGYWVSFRGYEGEKDNDILVYIRDKFDEVDSFQHVFSENFHIFHLLNYLKKKGSHLKKEDIIFGYLKYCRNVLKIKL